ncbi:MAG: hypothetical protein MJZ63_01235 [Muribaculaceae bacterium]|nr:hypothetical protein [Muribaculaceae bacterium]
MNIHNIDINFDFTTDTPHYWDNFWVPTANGGFKGGTNDPDSRSKMLREYHKLLWSRPLPNGENMILEEGKSKYYLKWNNIYFGSDSIIISFKWNTQLMNMVRDNVKDFKKFIEIFFRKSYTIGGMMLFPSFNRALNQSRGCHPKIRDRWDLTMECIRRHYEGEESPLTKCLNNGTNPIFFEKFQNFKGFVDFFFLQDCVSTDYSKVCLWHGDDFFNGNPIPKDYESYKLFIENQLEFLENRNNRICSFITKNDSEENLYL